MSLYLHAAVMSLRQVLATHHAKVRCLERQPSQISGHRCYLQLKGEPLVTLSRLCGISEMTVIDMDGFSPKQRRATEALVKWMEEFGTEILFVGAFKNQTQAVICHLDDRQSLGHTDTVSAVSIDDYFRRRRR